MKKSIILMLLLAIICFQAIGLTESLTIAALKGPTAMGLVKMMYDTQNEDEYVFTLAASPDVLIPLLVRGEIDIACLPVSLAAILHANTDGGIKLTNINTLGVLYILQHGENEIELNELSGQTIYASGKASTPEHMLNYILSSYDDTDLNIVWKAEHTETLASFLNNPNSYAMLPEPFVTLAIQKSENIKIAVNLNEKWEKITGKYAVTGVTVANSKILEERPEDIDKFLNLYEESTKYVNQNVEQAANWIEEYDILNSDIASQALPRAAITFISGNGMQEILKPFYSLLYDLAPASTGNKLPGDDFYYVP